MTACADLMDGRLLSCPRTQREAWEVRVRTIRTTTISVLAVGMLAGGALGVSAQDEDLAPAQVTISYVEPPIGMTFEEETGLEVAVIETVATDPRATGILKISSDLGFVDTDGQVFQVLSESARLSNDAGAWTGPIITQLYVDTSSDGGPPAGSTFWQLTGEGAYDGLSMLVSKFGAGDVSGIIVPTGMIPEQPAVPTE